MSPHFDPQTGDSFSLNGSSFQVQVHPSAPFSPYGQEGRKAIVYQVADQNKKLFALKVFKPVYRQAFLVNVCEILKKLDQPGLDVCKRTCFDQNNASELISKYPNLEYAVLMPWIEGRTWQDLIQAKITLSKQHSLFAARNVAKVLMDLEQKGFAHCDVAGANLIVNPKNGKINFVDVEDMFGPELPQLSARPKGTDGYRHRTVEHHSDGQWRAEGDRFAAAIILGEILCWHDENFREIADAEHYFCNEDLHDVNSPLYKRLTTILATISPDEKASASLRGYFEQAWCSKDLNECPDMTTWYTTLESLATDSWKPVAMPDVPLSIRKHDANKKSVSKISSTLKCSKIYAITTSVRINQKLVLKWSNIEDAHQYELQQAVSDLDAQQNKFTTVYVGSESSFEITHHRFGAFYYRVRSLNELRTDPWSPIEVVYVYPLNKPAVPQIYPTSLTGDRSYFIKWSSIENAQWYEVEESTGEWPFTKKNFVIFNNSSRIKDTQVLIVGKKAGRYTYRVRGYNYCGYSECSQPIVVDVKAYLTSTPPQILSIQRPSEDYIDISWGKVYGATGYILFEALLPELDQAKEIYQGADSSFRIAGREPGKYYYLVVAKDSNGAFDSQLANGWVSTKVILHTPAWHIPQPRYYFPASSSADEAEFILTWTPVKWKAGYELAWELSGTQYIQMQNTNSCGFRRSEGKYEFKVRAISSNKVASEWSPPIYITTRYVNNEVGYEIISSLKDE